MSIFSFFQKANAIVNTDLKNRFKSDLTQNLKALITYKGGPSNMYAGDIEKEAIFYICDVLLHQKSQAGKLPSEEIMTDIIKCGTDAMREILPKDYTEAHASYAQQAVRINLNEMSDIELQQTINSYYHRIRQ